jgi:hypothetical protein
MSKQFEVRDAQGKKLFELPKNVRVVWLTVGSERGELARIGVQEDHYITIGFETSGRLVPNLLEVEEAQREARQNFAEANSPDAPPDNEKNRELEGTPGSLDYIYTSDQPDYSTSEDHKEVVGTAASDSPSDQETGGEADPDTPEPQITSDEQTSPNPGQPSDPNKVDGDEDEDESDDKSPGKGNSGNKPGGLNL